MKKRAIKNGKKTEVIISEATDGVNKVRLIGSARAEEEECPWEEIDAYSGRFVVAGYRYGNIDDTDSLYHPWLAYSTDGGKTWTRSNTTADENQPHARLQALAYGGGRFVVAGHRYDTSNVDNEWYHPWLAYSTDGGKTWTRSDTTADENQPHGILQALAYGGGRFVVAGHRYDDIDDYHPWLAYSTDGGKTWTKSDVVTDTDQPHGILQALAYGGGRFVVAGYRYGDTDDADNRDHPWLAYSTDGGKTWIKSDTTAAEDQPHARLQALAYGDGRFVAAGYRYGDTDDDNTNRDDYHPWLAYSTDGGKTWTRSDTTADENQPHGILQALAYGGGRFVVAGYRSGGTDVYHPWLAYSTDGGKTWTKSVTTEATSQPHGRLYALTYAPDSYCWKFGTENEETEEEAEEA